METRYFEIEFGHEEKANQEHFDKYPDTPCDTYSICIIGIREPSIKEAEEFCKEDMQELGYECVCSVIEIDDYEAHNYFAMENEDSFPVFK